MSQMFASRTAYWIAKISYGLYVFQGMLSASWLGAGEKLVKYMKRPLLIVLTFILSHLSYVYLEKPAQDLGKRWTNRRRVTLTQGR
jgi:peptidoglycan/LPS O-acetylase OafA/YrhL